MITPSPPPALIEWGRIRAARADGQGLLLETVAIILGKRHSRSDEGTQERLVWLGPILQQNEAIGASYKQRRSPTDVNADTGEEVPTTQAP